MASDHGANQELEKPGINFSAPLETHSRVLRKGWNFVSLVQVHLLLFPNGWDRGNDCEMNRNFTDV